ncbi:ribonuclease H-like YkuK family protein [Aneurinibacillus sp. Ricciae_BoGa-3]|uniref:ribonuclease H-like YkuK family protein n=1 Tax=Aneurinibacillus sp. Ricciae_BoGa-3 TaxID=3022697 RepID=UPI0023400E5B|nr:ribonuclease H-like YkuK family protein [Aneurinibacillus sp. Ricciae_BoGa-3]WCK54938.1 ribonuclease H-like YkuK family protein [Aneurinibacillus sp. Ricciae_BoGa-3]
MRSALSCPEQSFFYNTSEQLNNFAQVVQRIQQFMETEPLAHYAMAIGTDSQVYSGFTKFTSAIFVHRLGKGAWGCLRDFIVPRPIKSLREKISLETSLSEEIAFQFTPEIINACTDIVLPYLDKGADFTMAVHLDIGTRGATKDLIKEMVGRIQAIGFEAKIKPDSYVASTYANRFTKIRSAKIKASM